MLKYERAILSEKELEDRIIKNPELIEDGLKYLEHQRQTTTGRFDILFIDGNNTLVVAELKIIEDTNMLFQALDYFDFVSEKIEGFTRIHQKSKINVSKYPRLMLIAPSFSPTMINRCRWLNPEINITLITFQYIKFNDINEDTLVFIPQEISLIPAILKSAPELADLLKYIKVKEAQELANRFLEETKELAKEIIIDPLQWGKSVKLKGNVIYYWEPRQHGVRISTINEDGEWQGSNITNENEYDRILELVKNNIKNK